MLANQFLLQHVAGDEFILSFGQVSPLLLLGSPEEQQEQAGRISFVGIKTLGRVSLPSRGWRSWPDCYKMS